MVETVCELDIRVKNYNKKLKEKGEFACMRQVGGGKRGDWRLAGWDASSGKLGWPGLPIAIALEEMF